MTATVQMRIATGATATYFNAETGFTMSREDSVTGTTGIPLPANPGTNYSWIKYVCLFVTTSAATTISARIVHLSNTPSTGYLLFFKSVAFASYAQASNSNMPAAAGSNAAVPAGYTTVTTGNQAYDSTSVSAGSTGQNGNFCALVYGIDGTNPGTTGTQVPLNQAGSTLYISYTEA